MIRAYWDLSTTPTFRKSSQFEIPRLRITMFFFFRKVITQTHPGCDRPLPDTLAGHRPPDPGAALRWGKPKDLLSHGSSSTRPLQPRQDPRP